MFIMTFFMQVSLTFNGLFFNVFFLMYLQFTMNVLIHAYDIIIKDFYLGKSVQVMLEFASCDSLPFSGVLITFSDSSS